MSVYCTPPTRANVDKVLMILEVSTSLPLRTCNQSSTPRYLDDLLNIGNPYFGGMVNQNLST